jgi:hypothetical protein
MDTTKINKLMAGHLEHFALCEKFGEMVVAMSKCLQDYVDNEDEAIDILFKAAGANLAARVDITTLDVDGEHVIKYCAVCRALLDHLKDVEHHEDEPHEDEQR